MKKRTKLNLVKEETTGRCEEALSKFQSLREDFRSREKKIMADLEKASRIWGKLGERFKWWQSLP